MGNAAQTSTSGGAPDRPVGMTVFEAVEKQLGLKLSAQRHSMPVIVIDQVERKSAEN